MNQENICDSFVRMKCEIFWNKLPLDEWQNRFATIRQSNILQSYHYAQAAAKTWGQRAQWGLITIDGVEAGLVQLMESKILFGAIHGVILDRGPLWFDGFGTAVHIKLFFDAIGQKFPPRWGRKRRILPEIKAGGTVEQIIKQCGFDKKQDILGYQTIWWDLNIDDEQARATLKSNWRGSLKKAEKSGITIEWDSEKKSYPLFKPCYLADKMAKQYDGVSPKLLDNLALFSTQASPMIIGKAVLNGHDIGAILILTHGSCATYQIGWTQDKGRETCAHHLLLWQARAILKKYNVIMLDLGGINDQDEKAKGLSAFKRGTGGDIVQLAGHYY